jgi:hypothetical protein
MPLSHPHLPLLGNPVTPRYAAATNRGENGFVLATVLLFLVVVTVGIFFAAGLTRTNVQIVNNEHNQKEAFAAAEAGIDEALYRISLIGGDTAAITGINGGTAFDASLAPSVPGRDTTSGASDYGITSADTSSTSQILFVTTAPVAGQNDRVPSLQPPATNRSLYSTNAADSAPVDMTTTTNLTIGWDLCNAAQAAVGASIGCAGGAGSIRQYPPGATVQRSVVKIVSTGQSGSARQRITVRAVDCIPSGGFGNGSVVSLGGICSTDSLGFNGSTNLTAAGAVQVNAGADKANPAAQCVSADTGGAHSAITASAIRTVGSANGNFNPPAETGVLPAGDPYAALLPPCFTGGPLQCQGVMITQLGRKNGAACGGTASNPALCTANSATDVLSPGIYYGGISITKDGVQLQSGTYVVAGGGFNLQGNTTGGAFVYNTSDPDPVGQTKAAGAPGAFDADDGSLAAPTTGDFAGVVLFQDRAVTVGISLQGGSATRVLDGLVYALNANLFIKGGAHSATTISGSLIVKNLTLQGGTELYVQNASTPPPTSSCGTYTYIPISWQDF